MPETVLIKKRLLVLIGYNWFCQYYSRELIRMVSMSVFMFLFVSGQQNLLVKYHSINNIA